MKPQPDVLSRGLHTTAVGISTTKHNDNIRKHYQVSVFQRYFTFFFLASQKYMIYRPKCDTPMIYRPKYDTPIVESLNKKQQ